MAYPIKRSLYFLTLFTFGLLFIYFFAFQRPNYPCKSIDSVKDFEPHLHFHKNDSEFPFLNALDANVTKNVGQNIIKEEPAIISSNPCTSPIKVYVYKLPEKFHFGLFRPDSFNHSDSETEWNDFRVPPWPTHFQQNGLKQQSSVAYYLLADLLTNSKSRGKSAQRVDDPSEADIFFVPFFSSLIYDKFGKNFDSKGNKIEKQLQEELLHFLLQSYWWKKSKGRDHVIDQHHPNSLRHVRDHLANATFILVDFARKNYKTARLTKDIVVPYVHIVKSFYGKKEVEEKDIEDEGEIGKGKEDGEREENGREDEKGEEGESQGEREGGESQGEVEGERLAEGEPQGVSEGEIQEEGEEGGEKEGKGEEEGEFQGNREWGKDVEGEEKNGVEDEGEEFKRRQIERHMREMEEGEDVMGMNDYEEKEKRRAENESGSKGGRGGEGGGGERLKKERGENLEGEIDRNEEKKNGKKEKEEEEEYNPWLMRKTLLFFQGRFKRKQTGWIRKELSKVLKNEKDVVFIDSHFSPQTLVTETKGMHHSRFCLHLSGDTPSSCRLFDAIASQCIPVIISSNIELPFENVLDYSQFSLFFNYQDALKEGYLMHELRDMNQTQYLKMFNHLKRIQKHFEFQVPSVPGDGTHMIWHQIQNKLPNIRLFMNREHRLVTTDWWNVSVI